MVDKHKSRLDLAAGGPCCKVEAIVSVDERGQMVLPKELREKAKIRPGDKLAIISWEKARGICGFSLIKADDLTEIVRSMLGPMVEEFTNKKGH